MKEKIRIGCGAGFSGDRLEPAHILVEQGQLNYLVLECLAERTIALAQQRKQLDPSAGYDPLLERRMQMLLKPLKDHQVTLITNMGAANPIAAARKIVGIAKEQNLSVKVVAVTGDDVLSQISPQETAMESGQALGTVGPLLSANAYLGVEGILDALRIQPDIIITGRVADPSLFLAPMIYEFGWSLQDYPLLGKGTVVGHLLECAGQVSGGYFADPGKKDVTGLATLGYPYADVYADGRALVSKVAGTGGQINLRSAKEQLLYEVVNPHAYYTPDVIADFMGVKLQETGPNEVWVSGGSGREKPQQLKVSVGYQALFLGEGEITYAGANAVARARLAGDILRERLMSRFPNLRIDLIGHNSVHNDALAGSHDPYEVRLRVAVKTELAADAKLVGEEVEALYTNGPAGGGGVRKYVHPVIGIVSVLADRKQIVPTIKVFTHEAL